MRTIIAASLVALAAGAVSADTLARLRDSGEIRLGVRTDAAPLSFAKDGAPAGYTVEVCKGVAARLGVALGRPLTPVYVEVTAENRFDAVTGGRVDLLCGADTATLGRRETVDFSIPVYIDGATVMMKRGATTDFAGLAGNRVGVRAGTTTEAALKATLARTGVAAEIVDVDDHAKGVEGVLSGELFAYFADQSILMFLALGSGRQAELAVAGNVLTAEPQALAMALGDSDFRLAVDRALSGMFRDGEIARAFDASFAPAKMGDVMRALTVVAPLPE
jgi:polar amino acid transport system substrate-binding protein/glutamate/aspartate transport system substrate-binding protein